MPYSFEMHACIYGATVTNLVYIYAGHDLDDRVSGM